MCLFYYGCKYFAMSSMMMDVDSNSGNLSDAGSVNTLIPDSFIRKWALAMGIYTSNLAYQQLLLVSSVHSPNTGTFILLVCIFLSGRPKPARTSKTIMRFIKGRINENHEITFSTAHDHFCFYRISTIAE